jgi:hypothetical protein
MDSCKSPREATDDLHGAYVAWRAACVRVRAAYIAWDEHADFDRDLAFAAYVAALDCEEHAADMYAGADRRCPRGDRRRRAGSGTVISLAVPHLGRRR